jgi:DUF4097 and DUF4098 domain-containing protein YvlB
MKRAALALVAAVVLPVALATAQTAVDQKHPATPDGSVSVENSAGSTKITGWERPEVQVKGAVCAKCELVLSGSDNRVHVQVESHHYNPMSGKSDIEVFVPAGCSISVEGFSASIAIAGVSGSVKAETVNGTLSHSGPSKDTNLQSVNGTVETTKASGRVQAEAVNGTVTVRDASGELSASTVNGKLTIAGGSFSRAALETVSGSVHFEGAVAAKGSLSVESVSGPVELLFPAGFGGDFSVSTFSGAVTNELGPAAEKANAWTPQKELKFTSGSGGTRVTVETLSGSVSIRKKP